MTTDLSNKELLNEILKKIKEEGNKNKEEIKLEIKNENKKLIDILEQNTKRIDILEKKVEEIEKKFDNLDKVIRKNNLFVYGLEIPDSEPIESIVVEALSELLGIELSEADINNIFSIRKQKTPTIKIELISYLKKKKILQNCYKLKGKKIYISQDLSIEDRKDQKILVTHLKLAKEKKLNATIKGKTLIVNGEIYGIEELKEHNEDEFRKNIDSLTSRKRHSNSAPSTPSKESHSEIEHQTNKTHESQKGKNTQKDEIETKKVERKPNTPHKEPERKKTQQRTNSSSSDFAARVLRNQK